MRRILKLGDAELASIKEIREYAEAHPLSVAVMLDMTDERVSPIGNDPAHACAIPDGFRCVFSLDSLRSGDSYARHLSVSLIDGPDNMYPHSDMVSALMVHFGFTNDIRSNGVMVTHDLNPHICAINVIKIIPSVQ